jgi:pyruvate dehydrogenase phosphatase
MEDKLYVNEKEKLYAVFDGHGGDICSRYISEKLPKLILDKLSRMHNRPDVDYACLLKSSFIEADTTFLNEHKFMLKNSPTGSCGVALLEREGYLYVCNLGDSRVQLARTDESGSLQTVLLTNDHNTKNPREVQLVAERTSDPFPIRANITTNTEGKRVGGVLMLTRAFGDGVFKRRDMSMPPFISHLPYITSEPEINVHKIEPRDQFAVIASDGLYEHFTPEQVTSFIGECLQECKDLPREFAKIGNKIITKELETIAKLMQRSVDEVKNLPNKKTFMDDTTVIVLLLNRQVAGVGSP